MRVFERRFLAALGLTSLLAGCAPGSVLDQLPGDLAIPRGAPERPVAQYDYPAVHDMPPQRPTKPLTEAEQVRMEKDLMRVRNQQEGHQPPGKKTVPAAKNKPPIDITGGGDSANPKP